ncbi:MAG: carboxypeptidase-like regulatory domain-containing protein, partial [Parabacteroides sp.]|nr:carboxypeptidase-like regulatory domain-containing protein [Parabacteroides sp.]
MSKSKIVFICLFLGIIGPVFGQILIKGVVSDSITGEKLPYASVILKGTTIGTATDETGTFSFSSPTTYGELVISFLGYNTQEIKIRPGKTHSFNIRLVPDGITLNEVTIKPKREKYSKKNNPAVELVKKITAIREEHDPRNHDYFQYDQYEKILLALNEYKPKKMKEGKSDKYDFLVDYIDTLDIGTTILPVMEKEKVETVLYRKEPRSERRIVKGFVSSGVDDMFSRDGVQQFLNEVFREVDIFRNDIPLFLQRFVSPLS